MFPNLGKGINTFMPTTHECHAKKLVFKNNFHRNTTRSLLE